MSSLELSRLISNLALWTSAHEQSTAQPAEHVNAADFIMADGSSLRLSHFAGRAFPSLATVTQGKVAAKADRLLVNGVVAEPARLITASDRVTLLGGRARPASFDKPEAIVRLAERMLHDGFAALYEDGEMAVVYKPAGIHSKPYRGEVNLEFALPALLGPPSPSAADSLPAPVAVHRLDARVCGLLLIGKTRTAAAHLAGELEARRARKRYRALLLGSLRDLKPSADGVHIRERRPEDDSAAAEPDGGLPSGAGGGVWEVRCPIEGKACLSVIRVVQETPHLQAGAFTTVDMWPCTGRRHQLRIHAAALGHPILGDDVYMGEHARGAYGAGSQIFLQSVEVKVRHPSNGGFVHVRTPEAKRFGRRRERALMGWEFEQRLGVAKGSG
jgi:23S rRNA-/tRNA-specific pseudouridylate synthase